MSNQHPEVATNVTEEAAAWADAAAAEAEASVGMKLADLHDLFDFNFTVTPADQRCDAELRLLGQPVALRCGKPRDHAGQSHGSNMVIHAADRHDYITVLWVTRGEDGDVR